MAEGLDLDEGHIEWYTATLVDEEEENGFMKIWMANINPVIGGDPRMGEGDSGKAQTSGESPQKNAQTLCESSRGGEHRRREEPRLGKDTGGHEHCVFWFLRQFFRPFWFLTINLSFGFTLTGPN